MVRHSWYKVNDHKAICRKCGFVRLHVSSYAFHRWVFERDGTILDNEGTPPCDETWPEGWVVTTPTGEKIEVQ